MSFFGIGPFEMAIIGLVAFIFLGPERMVEVARFLGRITREVRKMTAEVRDMVDIDELTNPLQNDRAERPKPDRPNGPAISPSRNADSDTDQAAVTTDAPVEPDSPVSFKSAREQHREKEEEQATQQDAAQPEERS